MYFGSVKIVEGAGAMEKPAIKLFTWKKAILIITICVGTVSCRTYESYHQKGHLDSVDLGATSITIFITFCIVAFVGWWANGQE